MQLIEKRRVEMTNDEGALKYTAVDYVPLGILEAYVADAEARWQSVTVGDTHDSGPGGDQFTEGEQ